LGGITIGCDNKGALQQVQRFNEYIPCSTLHADLVHAINNLQIRSLIDIKFVYVPGHQDVFLQFEDLYPLACLNVWADHLAKQELYHLATLPIYPKPPDSLTGESWFTSVDNQKITSDPRPPILDTLGQQQALCYWELRGQLSSDSFYMVQWVHLKKALKAFPHTFQTWLSKFALGHSAVGVTMHQWKKWDSALCPVCCTQDETTLHVLLCPHHTCQCIRDQQVD